MSDLQKFRLSKINREVVASRVIKQLQIAIKNIEWDRGQLPEIETILVFMENMSLRLRKYKRR